MAVVRSRRSRRNIHDPYPLVVRQELVLRIVLKFPIFAREQGTRNMLLQIVDTTALMDQAIKTQPGDYSGYVFAVTLLSTMFSGSLVAIVYLHRMVNKLQDAMVLKVETMATRNTELLTSIETFFEKITHDIDHIPPSIVKEAETCSARIKEHMNAVGAKIQKNEPISTDSQYLR